MITKIRLLFISLILLLCTSSALADSGYSIENYSLSINVHADGSAEVTETLLYDFDGSYNGVLSLFDPSGLDGLEDFRIFIDGAEMTPVSEMTYISNTYTVTELNNLLEIRVYSPGNGNQRAVTYEYTMKGLAKRYADTGLIHRRFIGENSSVTLQNAVVRVNFPGNGEIKAFVHGGMDGSHITAASDSVVFGPKNVTSGSWVEMRILFPCEWISDAPLIDAEMYDDVLAEEASIAEEERQSAIRTENAKYIFTAAYLVVFFAVWALMTKKYGTKNQLRETADSSRIFSYPAAFLTAAIEDEADTDALTGTLMELVADGSIRMEPEGEGIRFTQIRKDFTGYYPHQMKLTDWLFDERDFFLLSDLNAGSDYERAQQFETGYNRYISQVSEDMLTAGLRYKNDGLRTAVNAFIILLGAIGTGGVLLAGTPNILLGLLLGGSMFLLIALMSRVRRLTDEGERLLADAEAFKASAIPTDSGLSGSVAYLAALGMTEPLIKAMEFGGVDSSPEEMPGWMFTGWYYSLHLLNGSVRDAHHHNASIPNPSASSSHSSGNGGGGGHGAW